MGRYCFVIGVQRRSHNGDFSGNSLTSCGTCPASSSFQSYPSGGLVNAEYLGNLFCSFERNIFYDCLKLVVANFRRAAATFLNFEAHIATAKPLNQRLTVNTATLPPPQDILIFHAVSTTDRRRRFDGSLVSYYVLEPESGQKSNLVQNHFKSYKRNALQNSI